jgi:hypothetical protein
MKRHLDFAVLVEYWFGEVEEQAVEEHLFACAECSARLEDLVRLGAGIRAALRSGVLRAVLPRDFVERLKGEGLRLREYRVAPGGSVNCTLTGEDHFVLSRLQAPLAGVERLDLVYVGPDGEAQDTFEDIPFDAAAGEVLVLPSAAAVRAMPAHTFRMRLVALGAEGAKTLGDYTFNHTPG